MSINILGYQYTIDRSKTVDEIGALGRYNHKSLTIQIARDLEPPVVTATLLHEIVEALNYCLELNLEHAKITALETGLWQVLSENGVNLGPLLKDETSQSELAMRLKCAQSA